MRTQSESDVVRPAAYSRRIHFLACVLVAAAFPLIWVGGLVTTYGAGMAVPDWPATYGWNMFLYPPSTWIFGGFDLLVEHGHRLLASFVGLITVVLWLAVITKDSRRWFRWWCSLVLLAVVLQGMLGGIRVLLDQRLVALIHGCAAQLFLAMATATAVMCSRWWMTGEWHLAKTSPRSATGRLQPPGRGLAILITGLLALAYFQVIAGASLRHIPVSARPGAFMGIVHIHLTLAALVLLCTLATVGLSVASNRLWGGVKKPIFLILLTVVSQILLGLSTWVANYALPWQELNYSLSRYTIVAKGYWESLITTGHVATGALLISLLTLTAIRAWRARSIGRDSLIQHV